jgi:hypothetical protein
MSCRLLRLFSVALAAFRITLKEEDRGDDALGIASRVVVGMGHDQSHCRRNNTARRDGLAVGHLYGMCADWAAACENRAQTARGDQSDGRRRDLQRCA